MTAGLYIHIPFCHTKCPYCDFYSLTTLDAIDDFIAALLVELNLVGRGLFAADTLYLGGGTPSVLTPVQLGRILEGVHRTVAIAPDAEITLEVNPGTVTKADVRALRSLGVNRLVIGLQSLREENLRFLGRLHSARQGAAVYRWSRDAGFENVGVDLIYALPGQKESTWQQELDQVAGMRPEHLSCYTLTLEPNTPMAAQVNEGRLRPLDEKTVGDLFSLTTDCLGGHGYEQYEISNFARNDHGDPVDRRSRHNRKYWNFDTYLGFGPSAHSFRRQVRWWNHRSLKGYLAALKKRTLPVAGEEVLNREQQMIEFFYLGLRQSDGIERRAFCSRFGADLLTTHNVQLTALAARGWVDILPERVCLTRRGMRYHESVVQALID